MRTRSLALRCLGAAVALCILTPSAHAVLLTDFQFNNNDSSSVSPGNLTVSDMTTVNATAISYNNTDVTTLSTAPAALAGGFDESVNTSYYVFTMTPDEGYRLYIDGISFYARSGSTGPGRDIELTAVSGGVETSLLTSSLVNTYSFESSTTSATSAKTTAVRLYGTDFAGSSLRIDDMRVEGRVVPMQILALFNFNDMTTNNDGTSDVVKENVVGTPTLSMVENGTTLADADGQTGTSFTDLEGTNHTGGLAAGWTAGIDDTPGNDYFELEADTTGYRDMVLRFDYRVTNLSAGQIGPSQLTIEWAVDDGPYTEIDVIDLVRNNNYHEWEMDLASINGIEDIAGVKLRGTWSADGVTSSGGASARIDNLQLTGTAVPEPTTLATVVFGLVGVAARRRRR